MRKQWKRPREVQKQKGRKSAKKGKSKQIFLRRSIKHNRTSLEIHPKNWKLRTTLPDQQINWTALAKKANSLNGWETKIFKQNEQKQ